MALPRRHLHLSVLLKLQSLRTLRQSGTATLNQLPNSILHKRVSKNGVASERHSVLHLSSFRNYSEVQADVTTDAVVARSHEINGTDNGVGADRPAYNLMFSVERDEFMAMSPPSARHWPADRILQHRYFP